MKNLRILAGLAVIVAAVAFALSQAGGCKTAYRSDKQIRVNSTVIKAEVASTSAQQAKGLGGRACIGNNQGMLFVFNRPSNYAFWMKDMRFPIDIIWIDANHKVVAEEIDVQPSTYPDRFVNKDKPAQYVLELKAERARSLKINLGTIINF